MHENSKKREFLNSARSLSRIWPSRHVRKRQENLFDQ